MKRLRHGCRRCQVRSVSISAWNVSVHSTDKGPYSPVFPVVLRITYVFTLTHAAELFLVHFAINIRHTEPRLNELYKCKQNQVAIYTYYIHII